MSVSTHRNVGLLAAAAVLVAIAGNGSALANSAPPPAGFTPNVRADAALTASQAKNDNEPQVTVDQSGATYVTWQGGQGPTAARTTDGHTFTNTQQPDAGNVTPDVGDVAVAASTWPRTGIDTAAGGVGENGVFWGAIGQTLCGALEIREATSRDQGGSWSANNAACDPNQVDRPWIAAYTPPQYRGTTAALAHTEVFFEHHDFTTSDITVTRSFDGGASWNQVPQLAEQPGSFQQLDTTCNSIPSGIAFDQRSTHRGRVYVIWETSDLINNLVLGCNYTQAQTFDRLFMSYSDDGGNTWTSTTVFSAPLCAKGTTSVATTFPDACQDLSELFNALAVDDAGNVYVAFVWRNVGKPKPEYDVYVEKGTPQSNGTVSFGQPVKANTDSGTHYMPWLAAGQNGAVDVVFFGTPYVQGAGAFNKPAAAPGNARWNVYMAQSLDGGKSFTQSRVSDHDIYFGDICSTGIFCGLAPPQFGWGQDRILFDDFGVAIGPDGAARVAWTDARDSWSASCGPNVSPNDDSNVPCQSTHLYFACQSGGVGLYGRPVSGCPIAVGVP